MTFPTTSLVFDPLRLLACAGWFGLGMLLVQHYALRRVMPMPFKCLTILGLLLLGPIYLPAWFGFEIYRRVQRDGTSVRQAFLWQVGWGHPDSAAMTGDASDSIVLLDTNGRSLSQLGARNPSNTAWLELTNRIIGEAVMETASDILIHPSSGSQFNVRYRLNGALRTVRELSEAEGKAVVNSIKAISGMDIAEKRRPQDGAFTARTPRGSVSFRVATAGVLNGEKVSVRVLDQSASQFSLHDVGLAANEQETIKQLIARNSGMILVCGPTGSGKSSTVHAMLRTINSIERNVITIEDPIEYVLPDASQIEINTKAGITFASALRSVLRQDPDVISVGEIRDAETAEIALQAAQTGHLVFATVHSGSNMAALLRLTDLGIRPLLIASALNAVLSQRLVRRLCDHCKAKARFDESQTQALRQQNVDPEALFGPVGCEHCHGTGFGGRTGVFDLKVMDNDLKARLTSGNITVGEEIVAVGPPGARGMTHMQVQGTQLAMAGIIPWEEVMRLAASIEGNTT